MLPGEPPHADDVAPRGTREWRQAVNAHRAWVAENLWQQQHTGNLNLSDPNQMRDALAGLGIADEVGGGRHAFNLFMPGGALASEGFGMSPDRDIAYALEAYMPDWQHNRDRAIQGGMSRFDANTRFVPGFTGSVGAAGYPETSAASGTAAPSFAAPGPSRPGIGTSESGGMAGGSMSYNEDDPLKRARMALQKRGSGLTLGNLAEWAS